MEEVCENCEPVCEECIDEPETLVSDNTNEGPALPPGIKTEAVLMLLGNISNALQDMANGINSTITQIVTEGSKLESTDIQGELFDEQDN